MRWIWFESASVNCSVFRGGAWSEGAQGLHATSPWGWFQQGDERCSSRHECSRICRKNTVEIRPSSIACIATVRCGNLVQIWLLICQGHTIIWLLENTCWHWHEEHEKHRWTKVFKSAAKGFQCPTWATQSGRCCGCNTERSNVLIAETTTSQERSWHTSSCEQCCVDVLSITAQFTVWPLTITNRNAHKT